MSSEETAGSQLATQSCLPKIETNVCDGYGAVRDAEELTHDEWVHAQHRANEGTRATPRDQGTRAELTELLSHILRLIICSLLSSLSFFPTCYNTIFLKFMK